MPNPGNPKHFNRYSYVDNSPLGQKDPSGHLTCAYKDTDSACDDWLPPTDADIELYGSGFAGDITTTEAAHSVAEAAAWVSPGGDVANGGIYIGEGKFAAAGGAFAWALLPKLARGPLKWLGRALLLIDDAVQPGILRKIGSGFSKSEERMAELFRHEGNDVVLRAADPALGKPQSDLLVNGVKWDVYAPNTGSIGSMVRASTNKARG